MGFTYKDLDEKLGAKSTIILKRTRAMTRAERLQNGAIGVRLHETHILTYHPNGDIVLDTGGWRTVTTRARMNDYLPAGWGVYQKQGEMRLECFEGNGDQSWAFQDGMVITANAEVLSDFETGNAAEQIKAIKEYADGFVHALKAGDAPRGGDCFVCCMGADGVDAGAGIEHIEGHMEESYYVLALLGNAVDEYPVSQMALMALNKYEIDGDTSLFDKLSMRQIRTSIIKYISREFDREAKRYVGAVTTA